MKITLYHGSDHIVEHPVFGFGKHYNDYGVAFYCTLSLDMAKEWGSSKDMDGFANQYEIELEGLDILDLGNSQGKFLSWLAVLLDNRLFDLQNPIAKQGRDYLLSIFLPPYQNEDIIIGYRADDSYFSFAQDFLNNSISYRQLTTAMKLGKLGEQYAIKSRLAFSRLKYLGYENVKHKEWFQKKSDRDLSARKAYIGLHNEAFNSNDLFMRDILAERINPNDPRLR